MPQLSLRNNYRGIDMPRSPCCNDPMEDQGQEASRGTSCVRTQ